MAYADPPYLGSARKHYGDRHRRANLFDGLPAHRRLIVRLCAYFPDGWALSLASVNLAEVLPLCPADARVGAWVKPFAVFKPGVNPAYAWEPVIFRGGRRRYRREPTVRDWVSCSITIRKGLAGAKPPGFARWLFDLLGLTPADTFCDLFPGTGAIGREWRRFRRGD